MISRRAEGHRREGSRVDVTRVICDYSPTVSAREVQYRSPTEKELRFFCVNQSSRARQASTVFHAFSIAQSIYDRTTRTKSAEIRRQITR